MGQRSGMSPDELDRSPASSFVSMAFRRPPMLGIMVREGRSEDFGSRERAAEPRLAAPRRI